METNQTRHRAATQRAPWRLALIALTAALLAVLALPGAALAARGLTTGFQSDYYQSPDASVRNLWFQKTVEADAGIIRLNVPWITIGGTTKPADPANPATYNAALADIDAAVRDAKAHGLQVMLVANGAPPWAEGPGRPADAVPGSWRPNPADFADFAKALAIRYSGNFPDPNGGGTLPPVEALEVWNEPNTSGAITPTFEGKTDVAAGIFRDLLNAAYDAVKSVNPRILVVTGGTAPYGDPPGGPYPPGIERVRPVTFWEDVLCVNAIKSKKKKGKKGKKKAPPPRFVRKGGCNGPVKFDVLSHHAIDNTGKGPLASGPTPDDASTPDLARITQVLRGAEKAGTTQGGKHPIWVTEFWWDSKPPNPSGAPLLTQARWIEQSLYLFWKAGADTAFNFVIGDTPTRPNVHAGFQGGAFFQDGRPKPALTAFQFPFVTAALNRQTLEAWGKSPAAGKLLIQRKQRGWKTIKKLRVGKGSVFVTKLKLSGKQLLRAKVGPTTSLTWKQAAFGGKGKSSSSGGLSGWQIVLIGLAGLALVLVAAGVFRRQVARRRAQRSGGRLRHIAATTSGRPA